VRGRGLVRAKTSLLHFAISLGESFDLRDLDYFMKHLDTIIIKREFSINERRTRYSTLSVVTQHNKQRNAPEDIPASLP